MTGTAGTGTTTVRMPVRIRLDLDPAQPHDALADLVRDATASAADRAAERARRVPLVRDATWQPGPPGVTVRFTGDPVPQPLAIRLAAGVRAGLQSTSMRLPAAAGSGSGRRAAGSAARPAELRLRTFPNLAAVWDAVLDHYQGAPPAEVLVVAGLERRGPWQVIMTDTGTGERPLLRIGGPFAAIHLPVGGGDARRGPGGGMIADRLRFRYRADTREQWQAVLAKTFLENVRRGSGQRTPAQERALENLAAATAKRIPWLGPWQGPRAFYEFLSGDAPVMWYDAPAGITSGTIDVAVLTEHASRRSTGGGGHGQDCPPLDISSDDEADINEPYLGEPPVDQWPGDAAYLTRLIREIAARLRMPEGRYPGAFAIVAMAEIARQCLPIGSLEGGTLARQAELRRLAETTVLVNNLAFAYVDDMHSRDRAHDLPCPLAGHAGQWANHFFRLYGGLRRESVAQLFVSTCQDVLLEVLEKSAVELDRRLDRAEFPRYMAITRVLLVIILSQSVELEDLRRRIADAKAREVHLAAVAWRAPHLHQEHLDWRRANADVVAAIQDGAPDARPGGAVAYVDGEYWAKDAESHWWSEKQLALAIGTAHAMAFRADPLLEKIKDLPEIVRRLRDAQRRDDERSEQEGRAVAEEVDATFHALLEEIRQENRDRTERVRRDRRIAFGLASFTEDRTDEIGARLSGLYRLADERLRPMFDHEQIYLDGLRELADAERGKAELTEFFTLVGLVFLAVFCPPAAFLAGGAVAVDALVTAYEHRGIQRAMLGGDEIISRVQVEAELWAAWIGAALSFLPEVPKVGRGVARVAGRVLPGAERRAAAIAATRLAGEGARRTLTAATGEALVSAFLREVVSAEVMNVVLSAAIDRFIEAVVAEDPVLQDPASAGLADELREVMTEAVRASNAARGGS